MNTEKWTNQIDIITNSFKKEFGNLTTEQLNWKPGQQSWSIAQNIDHLIIINESYYPIIGKIRKNKYNIPWLGKIGFIPDFFGKFILKSVQPDRKKKMKTFPIWEPVKGIINTNIIDKFEKHQSELKRLITDCHDLLNKDTVISSPANRNIVYKLASGFDIIVAHEKRHFEQAQEVLKIQNKKLKPVSAIV